MVKKKGSRRKKASKSGKPLDEIKAIEKKTIESIPKKIPKTTDSKRVIQVAFSFIKFDIEHLLEGEDMDSHAWATIGIASVLDDSNLISHDDYSRIMVLVDKASKIGEKQPGANE